MKIYCEQCKIDISQEVDKSFEKIILGRIKCPKCNNKQGRFVSDTDLYLYLGVCELIYIPITIASSLLYDGSNKYWWLLFGLLFILGLVAILQKNISRYVYKRNFKKIHISEQNDIEKINILRKEINTSFVSFFAMAFGYIMVNDYRSEFIFGLFIIMAITFMKFYLSLRNK